MQNYLDRYEIKPGSQEKTVYDVNQGTRHGIDYSR